MPKVVDAATLADRIGASAEWVRAHYLELGGWRLGHGAKAPYRFDPVEADRIVREWGRKPQDEELAPSKRPASRTRRERTDERKRLLSIRGTDPT